MFGSSRYQENLNIIKYGLLIANVFFMITAVKSVVNHQIIIDSIIEVKNETETIQERTHHINNFLTPYLRSEFAPYFFAHENNQIFPEEKIIKITTISKQEIIKTLPGLTGDDLNGTQTNQEQRHRYIIDLTKDIRIGYQNIPFLQ